MSNGFQKSYMGFRISKSGEFLSFTHAVGGKKVRLGHKQGFPQKIFTFKEAELAKEKLLDNLDRDRKRRCHHVAWVKHFSKSHKDLIKFRDWRKKNGINNYSSEYGHLKNHVFPFFLGEINILDPLQWFYEYEEFKEWLDERRPLRSNTSNEFLSDNTKNNIIRAMHSFFNYLERKEKFGFFKKCTMYDESGFRGLDDLISLEENELMEKKLRERDDKYAIYWSLLHKTGLRPSEGLGLHMDSIVIGRWEPEEEWAGKQLKEAGINVFGYILLKDQPRHYYLREKDGGVQRKPLKCKKRISPEGSRIVPIMDKELAQDLLRLKKESANDYGNSKWSSNREDYLIFGFTYQQISKIVRELSDQFSEKRKSLYCLRHTFITEFSAVLGGDTRLAEVIVGHIDKKMMVRYNKLRRRLENRNHIRQQSEDLDQIEVKPINFG